MQTHKHTHTQIKHEHNIAACLDRIHLKLNRISVHTLHIGRNEHWNCRVNYPLKNITNGSALTLCLCANVQACELNSTAQNAYHSRDEKKKTNFFGNLFFVYLFVCLLVSVLMVGVCSCMRVLNSIRLLSSYVAKFTALSISVFQLHTKTKTKNNILPCGQFAFCQAVVICFIYNETAYCFFLLLAFNLSHYVSLIFAPPFISFHFIFLLYNYKHNN